MRVDGGSRTLFIPSGQGQSRNLGTLTTDRTIFDYDKKELMAKLEDVSVADLHEALDAAVGKKETQRLMLAILYKQGPSVPMLSDWFDMRERTVYDWFDRLEAEPLDEAIHDKPRPGRPPKLTDEQRATFEAALDDAPPDHGIEASAWTPAVAQTYLREQFDAEFTRRHVRRLLHDAGLSW